MGEGEEKDEKNYISHIYFMFVHVLVADGGRGKFISGVRRYPCVDDDGQNGSGAELRGVQCVGF